MLSLVSYGVGTVIGLIVLGALIVLVIHDVTQKKHTVLRNYPVIGRLRFFSSRTSASTSASTFSRATATRCHSTAPRAAGSTAAPRTKVA